MMNRMTKNERQRGFTLLEMLVAVSLLAIGLLATASMQGTALNANSIANKLTTASSLAQEVMEDLLAQKTFPGDMFHVAAPTLTYDLDTTSAASDITIKGGGTYRAMYSITPNDPVTGTTKIVVNITVVLGTAQSGARAVTLTGFKRLTS